MAAADLRIALVSREVYPLYGGGLGNYVTWAAQALSGLAEVTIITSDARVPMYEELRATGDPRLPPGVRFEFVEEPHADNPGSYLGVFHQWSARVFEKLVQLYPDGGPDLVEFPDYHGEGAVTVQAKRSSDPRLRRCTVCVRFNTSAEMCQVLDGFVTSEFAFRAMFDLERYSIANADRAVWPGGDVLGTYRRFYGPDAIAPDAWIPHTAYLDPGADPLAVEVGEAPLKLLYIGRYERRKGLQNLLTALLSLERDDWSLTIVGGDTFTGPLGISVRKQMELTAAEDPRVHFSEAMDREKLLQTIDNHDLCVVPSIWECWPNVALEAFQRGRPVLATPVGGLVEMVKPGRSGWLAEGTSPEQIAAAVATVLDSRDELTAMTPHGPREVFAELTEPARLQEAYVELAREARRRPAPVVTDPAPLVTVVVTYFKLDAYIEETIASLCSQSHPNHEVLVVNDGSLREQDSILFELAERYPIEVITQPNAGLSAARNFGIAVARGDYVMPFDADDIAEPTLIERCLQALEGAPEAVYATPWSRFMHEDGRLVDDGYQPIGNFSPMVREQNVAGSAVTLFRRELFDSDGFSFDTELTSYEDWYLFRQLHEAGRFGVVVPERLFRYRVRAESMLRKIGDPHSDRFREEMDTLLRRSQVQWEAKPSG